MSGRSGCWSSKLNARLGSDYVPIEKNTASSFGRVLLQVLPCGSEVARVGCPGGAASALATAAE
eukprot:5779726-Pyramimonas_sp.AAC.1